MSAVDRPEPTMSEVVQALLPEVVVRRWRGLPQPALLVPDGRRWLILVDPDLDQREQNLHVLHQVKHIVDAPDRDPDSCDEDPERALRCYRFAMSVLAPASRVCHDFASGHRDIAALARRYEVPTSAMRQLLNQLELTQGGMA